MAVADNRTAVEEPTDIAAAEASGRVKVGSEVGMKVEMTSDSLRHHVLAAARLRTDADSGWCLPDAPAFAMRSHSPGSLHTGHASSLADRTFFTPEAAVTCLGRSFPFWAPVPILEVAQGRGEVKVALSASGAVPRHLQ